MTKLIKHFHILIFSLIVGIITVNPNHVYARSTGPAAEGLGDRTGSPIGGSGSSCSNCHGGGAFSPTAQIELRDSNGMLVSGSIISGETYTITLNINAGSGSPSAYGFQLVVLDSANQNIGTFSNQSSGTQISPSGGVNFWEHSTPSAIGTFTVDWTPPAAMTMVTIYARGNAVNLNGGTSGDEASPGATFAQSLPVELMHFSID